MTITSLMMIWICLSLVTSANILCWFDRYGRFESDVFFVIAIPLSPFGLAYFELVIWREKRMRRNREVRRQQELWSKGHCSFLFSG